jgi:hypothetical protein
VVSLGIPWVLKSTLLGIGLQTSVSAASFLLANFPNLRAALFSRLLSWPDFSGKLAHLLVTAD